MGPICKSGQWYALPCLTWCRPIGLSQIYVTQCQIKWTLWQTLHLWMIRHVYLGSLTIGSNYSSHHATIGFALRRFIGGNRRGPSSRKLFLVPFWISNVIQHLEIWCMFMHQGIPAGAECSEPLLYNRLSGITWSLMDIGCKVGTRWKLKGGTAVFEIHCSWVDK